MCSPTALSVVVPEIVFDFVILNGTPFVFFTILLQEVILLLNVYCYLI